ncbi:MAG: methyltransferase [Solirubrobacterales bacterium]|nr:methyltransferase [Solirubrobacterales bacterium]
MYDEGLAGEIREALAAEDVLAEEKAMFGGLAFLVGGHMAIAASGQGGLMVRCAPEETDALLGEPGAAPFVMRGKEMRGWLRVDAPDVSPWVRRGVAFARSLPPK